MKEFKMNLEQNAQSEMTFVVENDVLYQQLRYSPHQAKKQSRSLPLGKAMKGSVLFVKTGNNQIIERIRLYKERECKRSVVLFKSSHTKLKMRNNKLTLSMQLDLNRDMDELRNELGQYSVLVQEEIEEIAYYLMHEAYSNIDQAWCEEEMDEHTNQ